MNPKKIFAELQRRNVYKVAVAYAVVGWLVVQIATQVFPFFEVPHWAIRMVVIVLLLGFPVALVLAWAFELTPEGLVRTEEVDAGRSIARSTGRKLDFIIIGVLLAVIAFLAFQHYGPPRLSEKSIAVLPFVDLSASKDQEYFSDGLTDQIINSLTKMRGLFVVARNSVLALRNKNQNQDLREVGRLLRVSHVLEGSVTREADRVRVGVHLIDVKNGFQLWSESYDAGAQDVFSLQSEMAQKVASALRTELHLPATQEVVKMPTQVPEAYALYQRGRYLLNKRTVDSIQKALALFWEAVDKDPQFALARAGVADSYILLGKIGQTAGEEAAARAWPEVSAALSIDPQLADGYVSRGILLNDFEWNWPAAEADFQKALALNPNNAAAHHWYARHLKQLGRSEEALREIASALKNDPLSATIWVAKGNILFCARRYGEAVEPCKKALELEQNFPSAYQVLARSYAHLGKHSEAIEAVQKYVELSDGSGWSLLELAYAHAVAGNRAESDRIVNAVTAGPRQFSPYDMATICSAWRDANCAMPWLERAIDQRSVDVIEMRADPRLDNVRLDPRFKEILTRIVPRR